MCTHTNDAEQKARIRMSIDCMNNAVNASHTSQRTMVSVIGELHCKKSALSADKQQL